MKKNYVITALTMGFSMHLRTAKAQYEEAVKKFNNPCSNVEGSYDDFRKTKEMHTAAVRPDTMGTTLVEMEPAVFYKTLSKGKIAYSLSLNTTDSVPATTNTIYFQIVEKERILNYHHFNICKIKFSPFKAYILNDTNEIIGYWFYDQKRENCKRNISKPN